MEIQINKLVLNVATITEKAYKTYIYMTKLVGASTGVAILGKGRVDF